MSHREVHAGRALDRLVGLREGGVAIAVALGVWGRDVILVVGFGLIGFGWFWSILLGIAIAVALLGVLIFVLRFAPRVG